MLGLCPLTGVFASCVFEETDICSNSKHLICFTRQKDNELHGFSRGFGKLLLEIIIIKYYVKKQVLQLAYFEVLSKTEKSPTICFSSSSVLQFSNESQVIFFFLKLTILSIFFSLEVVLICPYIRL